MLIAICLVMVFFHGLFIVALLKKDNSIVDIGWGMSFIILASTLAGCATQLGITQLITLSLVVLWGLRLSLHIALRKRGHGEDFRYQQWREQWGQHVIWRSYLQVFVLQMLVMLIISLPLFLIFTQPGVFAWYVVVGILVAVFGLVFEALSDWQLVQFKRSQPQSGAVIQSGLWRLCRHPNYFGEACFWWGIAIMGLSVNYGVIGLIGALTINLLVRYVSGVPLLETKYKNNPEFQRYAAKTPVFVPRLFR